MLFSSVHDPNMYSCISGGQEPPAKAEFQAAKREKDPSREQDTACTAGRPGFYTQDAF